MTAAANRDLLVGHVLGGVENQPRALHDPERQRQRRGPTLKLNAILLAELDPVAARPRHASKFAAPDSSPLHNSTNFQTAPLVH
jgi:hypothetical protein